MSLLRDPETGHLVGIEQAPVRPAALGDEYPKWVDVHESHVNVQKVEGEPDHVSVHGDWQHHVDRDGKVTVLAEDEDGAKAAAAEYKAADAADIQHLDEETLREVRADFKRAADAKHWDEINAALAERKKAIIEETLRRMKEKQELINRNREEAVRLAAENRERFVAPLPGTVTETSRVPGGLGPAPSNFEVAPGVRAGSVGLSGAQGVPYSRSQDDPNVGSRQNAGSQNYAGQTNQGDNRDRTAQVDPYNLGPHGNNPADRQGPYSGEDAEYRQNPRPDVPTGQQVAAHKEGV